MRFSPGVIYLFSVPVAGSPNDDERSRLALFLKGLISPLPFDLWFLTSVAASEASSHGTSVVLKRVPPLLVTASESWLRFMEKSWNVISLNVLEQTCTGV